MWIFPAFVFSFVRVQECCSFFLLCAGFDLFSHKSGKTGLGVLFSCVDVGSGLFPVLQCEEISVCWEEETVGTGGSVDALH